MIYLAFTCGGAPPSDCVFNFLLTHITQTWKWFYRGFLLLNEEKIYSIAILVVPDLRLKVLIILFSAFKWWT